MSYCGDCGNKITESSGKCLFCEQAAMEAQASQAATPPQAAAQPIPAAAQPVPAIPPQVAAQPVSAAPPQAEAQPIPAATPPQAVAPDVGLTMPVPVPIVPPPAPPAKRRAPQIAIAIGVMAVIAVLAVVLASTVFKKPLTADEWFSLGEKYLTEMDYEQAIVAFLNVIEIEPMNIPARENLADIYMELERYTEAEAVLLEILGIDERHREAYRILQDLYETLEEYGKLADLIELMRALGLTDLVRFGNAVGLVTDSAGAGVVGARMAAGLREVRTDAFGMFDMLLREGRHEISMTNGGNVPYSGTVEVIANETVYLPTIALISNTSGTGTLEGIVTDSITGYGVADAAIVIRDADGRSLRNLVTDSDGYYTFTADAGYYRAHITAPGFNETAQDITMHGAAAAATHNFALTPVLEDGEIRIVLTWGEQPWDLDSHLSGPQADGGVFHIFYADQETREGDTLMAYLDLDDTNSYGPETVTIYRAMAGSYRYGVHDYTNGGEASSTALARSGANVRVFIGNDTVREYNVPPDLTGDFWYVFDIENGELRPPSGSDFYDNMDGGAALNAQREGYIDGTPVAETRQMSTNDLTQLGLVPNMDIYEFIVRFGLPKGYASVEAVEEDLSNGGLREGGESEYYASYGVWETGEIAEIWFDADSKRLSWVSFGPRAALPFGARMGDSFAAVMEKLGIDSRISALATVPGYIAAVAFCRDNGIEAYLDNIDNGIQVVMSNGYLYMNWIPNGDFLISLSVYSEDVSSEFRFVNNILQECSVSFY